MLVAVTFLFLASAEDKSPLPLILEDRAKSCQHVGMVSAVRFTTGADTTQKELIIGASKKARKLGGNALIVKSISQNGASSNLLADAYKCDAP